MPEKNRLKNNYKNSQRGHEISEIKSREVMCHTLYVRLWPEADTQIFQ